MLYCTIFILISISCHADYSVRAVLGRVLRGSVELPLSGVHFFPMWTNTCLFMCLNSVRARRSDPHGEECTPASGSSALLRRKVPKTEMSSLVRTLGLWVRVPLKAGMFVCVCAFILVCLCAYSVFVFFCV
jgi:hypothetical protein